jgi:NADPH:quinone reductase-like Zn-dependent oxidoreductase
MNALVLPALHTPLQYRTDVAVPQPAAGQVRIRVQAAAVNHRDVYIQQGLYPGGVPRPLILGSDGAGVVDALGTGTDAAWLGREVVFDPGIGWGNDPFVQSPDYHILGHVWDGTFAEYVCVPATNLHAKPEHLSWQQAAAFPLAGVTAWRALMERAQAMPNDRVLITGIGAGTALFALQFAVAQGCEVWVTSSDPAKLERAQQLGARGGGLYTAPDWAKQLATQVPGGFDVAIDSAGGPGFTDVLKLMAPGGRVAFFGGTRGKWPELSPQALFWKQISLLGSTMGSPDDFAAMVDFLTLHQLVPVVHEVLPLPEGQQALERLHAGGQFGKVVLTVN